MKLENLYFGPITHLKLALDCFIINNLSVFIRKFAANDYTYCISIRSKCLFENCFTLKKIT